MAIRKTNSASAKLGTAKVGKVVKGDGKVSHRYAKKGFGVTRPSSRIRPEAA
jgi:hypothetical protein